MGTPNFGPISVNKGATCDWVSNDCQWCVVSNKATRGKKKRELLLWAKHIWVPCWYSKGRHAIECRTIVNRVSWVTGQHAKKKGKIKLGAQRGNPFTRLFCVLITILNYVSPLYPPTLTIVRHSIACRPFTCQNGTKIWNTIDSRVSPLCPPTWIFHLFPRVALLLTHFHVWFCLDRRTRRAPIMGKTNFRPIYLGEQRGDRLI